MISAPETERDERKGPPDALPTRPTCQRGGVQPSLARRAEVSVRGNSMDGPQAAQRPAAAHAPEIISARNVLDRSVFRL